MPGVLSRAYLDLRDHLSLQSRGKLGYALGIQVPRRVDVAHQDRRGVFRREVSFADVGSSETVTARCDIAHVERVRHLEIVAESFVDNDSRPFEAYRHQVLDFLVEIFQGAWIRWQVQSERLLECEAGIEITGHHVGRIILTFLHHSQKKQMT